MHKSGEAMLLPLSEAQSVTDAVIIADEIKLIYPADTDMTALCGGLLDMPVYTQAGNLKGNISDIFFAPSGKVVKLTTDYGEFTPPAIASIGDVMFLKGAIKAKAPAKKRSVTIPRPEKDYPVQILDDSQNAQTDITEASTPAFTATSPSESGKATITLPITDSLLQPAANISAITTVSAKPPISLSSDAREPVLSNGAFQMILDGSAAYSYDEDSHTPTRVICDYEFLLGRTLGADLRTYTGEMIATSGSAVTDTIVEKARRAGKLVELTLNSVKPDKKC